ncbi:MAG: hypothetical protein HPY81_03060 [Firmicutes bacterium]|nr:hypothetical protein [Bacillota bacterium]
MATSRYAFFWGCQIPGRLPFMEKATRLVMASMEINAEDLAGLSCCPERSLVSTLGDEVWLLAAARNLAVAEEAGYDLVTPCNGCYSSLRTAQYFLRTEPARRQRINEELHKIGLNYRGTVKIKHILDVFHDDIGPTKLKNRVSHPLQGMKVAVHYGCHLVRPAQAVHFDDPLSPLKYDTLITALGATSVQYPSKMLCCGASLGYVGEANEALALTRRKIQDAQRAGADAISLICPACFLQFDQIQYLAQKRGEALNLPVLTFTELVGLSLGLSPTEMGLDGHRVKPNKFLGSWLERAVQGDKLSRQLDHAVLQKCANCGACEDDCPVAQSTECFRPNALVKAAANGQIKQLLRDGEFWKCVECHTCSELCPNAFGMEKLFAVLKQLAVAEQAAPVSIKGGLELFQKSGRLAQPDQKARRKLGLNELPADGGTQLAELLGWK